MQKGSLVGWVRIRWNEIGLKENFIKFKFVSFKFNYNILWHNNRTPPISRCFPLRGWNFPLKENEKICKAIKKSSRGLPCSLNFFLTSLSAPAQSSTGRFPLGGSRMKRKWLFFYIFRFHPSIRWNEIKEIFPFVGRVKATISRLKARPIWGDGKL